MVYNVHIKYNKLYSIVIDTYLDRYFFSAYFYDSKC